MRDTAGDQKQQVREHIYEVQLTQHNPELTATNRACKTGHAQNHDIIPTTLGTQMILLNMGHNE